MERSYFEVKVSFLHVAVLLGGVILIGSFLFYLGYQAGKSSVKGQSEHTEVLAGGNKAEEIQLTDVGSRRKKKKKAPAGKEPSIQDELKMHQLPVDNKKTTPPEERVKTKPIKKSAYFSIQVGAFSDYANARKYSAKFANMGYPTEILSTVRKGKKLYRVRVGNFDSRAKAKKEMRKLEKTENSKFSIANPGQK
ncbi:MAG: SPOR domain-containing protein [bacterium]|nr:SPOR domain-containing protein [bacterium]